MVTLDSKITDKIRGLQAKAANLFYKCIYIHMYKIYIYKIIDEESQNFMLFATNNFMLHAFCY